MKRHLRWIAIALVLLLLATGTMWAISSRKEKAATLQAQQLSQKTATVIELFASDVVQARELTLAQGLALSGPLKAVNSAFLKARIAGELQDLTVREGDYVQAGKIIARVDATESQARVRQAQQQAESAKAQVDIAQRSFDNNRTLVEQGFISKTALDASASNLAAVQANYRAAQAGADVAAKSLDDTVLRAPISGQVAQRLAQPGERVAVDARIVEIVDSSRLELEASLSASDSLTVRLGQSAQLVVEGASKPVPAKVVRINPSAIAGSRAVLVYLALSQASGLRQGLFAQGTLVTGTTKTLAVPLNAVRTDKPLPYVQTIVNGQLVHQTVTLGSRGEVANVDMVGIGSGLNENADVVRGSVGTLQAGTSVKLLAGGL